MKWLQETLIKYIHALLIHVSDPVILNMYTCLICSLLSLQRSHKLIQHDVQTQVSSCWSLVLELWFWGPDAVFY